MSRAESVVDMSMLEHAIREDLDRTAPRAMCVLDPIKVVLSNFEDSHEEILEMARHPKDESMGKRQVPLGKEVYIDRADFEEDPPPGFKRLTPGGEVRLRGAYVIRCDRVEKDGDGRVSTLECSVDKDTLGKRPEGRKVKGVVHWVSVRHAVPVSVRLYDRLFEVENPEAKGIDYHQCLNPNSLQQLSGCVIEPSALAAGAAANFQFEREGYFCLDATDSATGLPVFNRTITLRDSWSG